MKKDQLKKIVGHRVRLRPVAKRRSGTQELPRIDDDWTVRQVEGDVIELSNPRTDHVARLGLDHIHSYLSDPGRDIGGIRYGFLQLRVQLCLRPLDVEIEPLHPGEWGEVGVESWR